MRVVYTQPVHDRIFMEMEKARKNNQPIEKIFLTHEEMDEFKASHVARRCGIFEGVGTSYFLSGVEIKEEI